MQNNIDSIKAALKNINQDHLLQFWAQLDESAQESLANDINQLDIASIPEWIEGYVKKENPLEVPTNIEPAPYFPAIPKDDAQAKEYAQAKLFGEDLIKSGKVGAFVVAGGQGTRLGYDGPKGNYPTSPIKEKTLFAIFAEIIAAAQLKYATTIPWYIMTSPLNNAQTVETLENNDYFGLNADDVFVFIQGTMPNFANDGKIFMSGKSEIAKSPDGHGGSLKALYESGAVADMQKRGVEQLSYFQVDNPLINIVDPLFIGLHAAAGAQMSSKALLKAYPMEKVGNFCLVEDKVTVIEYSDLPDEQANRTNQDGSLVFELGSIAIHLISRSFLEEINADGFALPFHKAIKKIPYIGADGELVNPKEINGVKLETFVFDALPLAKSSIIFETLREEEFAPVKNAEGLDSPVVTKTMMSERAAKWLEAAGVKIPRKADGKLDCVIEMAPSFALHAEDVTAKLAEIPDLIADEKIYLE